MDSQLTSKVSVQVTPKAAPLRQGSMASPPQIIGRELNIYGKMLFFGLYTLVCVAIGGMLFSSYLSPHSSKQAENGQLQQLQSKLHQDLTRFETMQSQDTVALMENNRFLSERLEERLQKMIQSNLQESSQIIRQQREQIAGLKNNLNELLNSSAKSPINPPSQVIVFSEENLQILRYQHQLQKEQLARQQKKELQAYISTLDLSLVADQGHLQQFKDRQKIEAYTLDQKLSFERKNFREVGHRNIASISDN